VSNAPGAQGDREGGSPLSGAFPVERIAAQFHGSLADMSTWAELQSRGRLSRGHADAILAEIHLPYLPSVEEIRDYAEQRLARTVSLDEIARRTRQILVEALAVRLLTRPRPHAQRDFPSEGWLQRRRRPRDFRH
jgi:hypothetical protein